MASQQCDWSGAKLKQDQYYFDDAQKTPVRDIRYTLRESSCYGFSFTLTFIYFYISL